MNKMIVNYANMSGDELKRIYKLSGLKSHDFAARLGLEQHQLYTQIGRREKKIDKEVEDAVKGEPEFAQNQKNLEVKQKDLSPIQTHEPSVQLLAKSLDMINETLMMVKDSLRIISDDNKFIKEDADIYRSIVKSGIDQGAIKFFASKK